MKRITKEPAKPLTKDEKIALLVEERRVLREETDDSPATLERVEHINREIAQLGNE